MKYAHAHVIYNVCIHVYASLDAVHKWKLITVVYIHICIMHNVVKSLIHTCIQFLLYVL